MERVSLQNKYVKEWTKLKEKKYRDETGLFLVEGIHLVEEAVKHQKAIEVILEIGNEFETDIPKSYVTNDISKKLTSQTTSSNIFAIVKKLEEKEYSNQVLILDNVQDPGNLGTIIRSAKAFGFKTILLSLDSVDLYNEKVIRSTEGLFFDLNILRKDIAPELLKLKEMNYIIYGTSVTDGTPLKNIDKNDKTAIIIGSEGKGMNSNLEQFVNKNIYIPMDKDCESLNASVSASIIMYEMGSQHE